MNHHCLFNDTFHCSNILDNDCSNYQNDEAILHNFSFVIQPNPSSPTSSMTYVKMTNKHVNEFHIIRQKDCIPSLIFCFKHLSILKIDNTSFCDSKGQLPTDIVRLGQSLKELIISNTEISHIPNEIDQLKYLERLDFSNTGLAMLSDSIGNLSKLRFLILHQTKFSYLPKTLHRIQSLHQVAITHNPNLRSIRSLNGHPTLRFLNTHQCPIEHIPQNLPQLTYLNMAENRLTHLHGIETLGNQTNETKIFLFYKNQIQILTPSIALIPKLFELNLAQNNLTTLPEDLFNVITLKELNIAKNHFNPYTRTKIIAHFHRTNPKLVLYS